MIAISQASADAHNRNSISFDMMENSKTGKAAEAGIASLIFIAALLSVNLGLINLLPIPLLDGGHLLFYAYEFVFRAPPHPKVVDIGLKFGLVLLISLMLFATYNDLEGIYNDLVNDLFVK